MGFGKKGVSCEEDCARGPGCCSVVRRLPYERLWQGQEVLEVHAAEDVLEMQHEVVAGALQVQDVPKPWLP